MRKKTRALKMHVYRLKKRLEQAGKLPDKRKLIKSQASSKANKIGELQKELSGYLSDKQLTFVMSQIKNAGRKPQGRRWSYKDKALALSLLHSSPKTYKLLRKIFDLPSVTTLKTVMKRINDSRAFLS